MNFWEAQKRAQGKTKVYLIAFIAITFAVAFFIEYLMRHLAPEAYHEDFPILGLFFLGITFGVASFQYAMFQSYGGRYVAESVGAILLDRENATPQEQQLLNIVEEVALAASLPVPPVYLMEADQINAFAAGLTPDNAAIAITQGALDRLNRDEIQGVIAHEFGHIYNGDMKISMRLAAMVMGFFFVLYLALRIFQFSQFGGNRRESSNGDQGRGGNPLLLAALLFMGAGAFTWFAGSILKAMVSREREYLADACAVQFTRNPHGIANALMKIEDQDTYHPANDMPKAGMAYSHMYLDNHVGLSALFATHPPLKKRIEAILGKTYQMDE